MTTNYKSGFVALIGRPNVGKSTLMNTLVGQKIAITSYKPQTTRNQISGIYTAEDSQIVFVDTPGIFKPRSKLDDYMDHASLASLKDVDLILFMIEPDELRHGNRYIYEQIAAANKPVFLVINKVDQVKPDDLLPLIDDYRQQAKLQEILPISATKGIGISDLLTAVKSTLPQGPQYYGSDEVTDRPEYFVVAELIREQILRLTDQEVPHATAVAVDQMNQRVQGKLQVSATIYVEKSGQKGIVLGKGASMLKQIGINARKQIEALLGEKINLKLWVKVQRNWRSDPIFLKRIGYDQKELS